MDSRQEEHDWEAYDEATEAALEDMGLSRKPIVYEFPAWLDWLLIFVAAGAFFWLGMVSWATLRG